MTHKVIFILASAVIFLALDLNWVYPMAFNHLPLIFSWVFASVSAGFELIALFAEWNYLA